MSVQYSVIITNLTRTDRHAVYKMIKKIYQRANIQFCVKNNFSVQKTFEMLKKSYPTNHYSRRSVFYWYQRFKAGQTTLNDSPRPGRPTKRTRENIVKVREMILKDRRLTVRHICDKLRLKKDVVHSILRDELQMRRVASKVVPKTLSDLQKKKRVNNSVKMLHLVDEDPDILKKVITGDESWVYGYDPLSKRHSSQWLESHDPVPKVARPKKSSVKCMLLMFFDYKGVVYYEWLPKGKTVTAAYYISCLHRLEHAVKQNRPELTEWYLHHDNASPHTAHHTQLHLALKDIKLLPHPPYSPDMAPCDFWLFFRTKKPMKGLKFASLDEIKENTAAVLETIKSEEFEKCILVDWVRRWKKCVLAEGEYFEGDKINVTAACPLHSLKNLKHSATLDHNYALKEEKIVVQHDHDYC